MSRLISRIRKPVKRQGSENYLIITLLSFGLSVGATRLLLELTGYPQLGNSDLHIAHVLWGGVFLFAAALLPLIFANRWAYTWNALLAGVGVGLFIDEVGKFITQSNDYFYPPAAPIIYAFFLLTVLLYLQVRRPPPPDPRAELYWVLDALEEVLDHDLDPHERTELKARLQAIANNSQEPAFSQLANNLLAFLESESLSLAPVIPTFWARWLARLQAIEQRLVSRDRLRAVLTGGLGALSLVALVKLGRLLLAAMDPAHLEQMAAEMVAVGRVASASGLSWFSARLALEGAVGLILFLGTIFFLLGKERRGFHFAYLGLLLSLTTVNLLVFYFEQFSTILSALIQFALLLGLLYYRRRYIRPHIEKQETL